MRSTMPWFIQLLPASPPRVLMEPLGNWSVSPLSPCGYSSLNRWPEGWPVSTHHSTKPVRRLLVDGCALRALLYQSAPNKAQH